MPRTKESGTNVYHSGPGGVVDLDPCKHDWRVNPVVVTTTPTGDCELLMCIKCQETKIGVPMSQSFVREPKRQVGPFDPQTWEKRP